MSEEKQPNELPKTSIPNANADDADNFERLLSEAVAKWHLYLNQLWKARWKFMMINTVIFVLALFYLLFLAKPYFDSTILILPNYGVSASSSALDQLGGLASLAGINVGSSNAAPIYEELITTESVLSPVIYAKYKTEEFPDSVNLIEYDELEADDNLSPELQIRDLFLKEFKELKNNVITTNVDKATQILSITVRMPEGQLSADIVNNIAVSLDTYIQGQMRTSASEQRRYIEKRQREVMDSLKLAEDKFKIFSETNKAITRSSALLLKQKRLSRNIEILNSVYLQLAQQAELIKIQEVKDAPVINIGENAKNPIKKTGPPRLIILIFIMAFSSILSSVYIIIKQNR